LIHRGNEQLANIWKVLRTIFGFKRKYCIMIKLITFSIYIKNRCKNAGYIDFEGGGENKCAQEHDGKSLGKRPLTSPTTK
jgi:hypothetical protein